MPKFRLLNCRSIVQTLIEYYLYLHSYSYSILPNTHSTIHNMQWYISTSAVSGSNIYIYWSFCPKKPPLPCQVPPVMTAILPVIHTQQIFSHTFYQDMSPISSEPFQGGLLIQESNITIKGISRHRPIIFIYSALATVTILLWGYWLVVFFPT